MAALIGVNKTPGGVGISVKKPGADPVGIAVKPAAGGSYTCKVPLDIISEDGVPPEEGDSVDYQVTGTVQSVDDENATIKIEAVNGQPVSESAADEASEDAGAAPTSSASMRPGLAAGAAKAPPMF